MLLSRLEKRTHTYFDVCLLPYVFMCSLTFQGVKEIIWREGSWGSILILLQKTVKSHYDASICNSVSYCKRLLFIITYYVYNSHTQENDIALHHEASLWKTLVEQAKQMFPLFWIPGGSFITTELVHMNSTISTLLYNVTSITSCGQLLVSMWLNH